MNHGPILKALLKDLKMPITKMAKLMGFRKAGIYELFKKKMFKRTNIHIICTLLGVHPSIFDPELSWSSFRTENTLKTRLKNINWTSADFSYQMLFDVQISHSTLKGINYSHSKMQHLILHHVRMENCNFDSTDLSWADFRNSKFIDCNFADSNLFHSDLSDSDLTDTDLSGANLESANVNNTDFTKANLTGANLSNLRNPHNCIIMLANIENITPPTEDFIDWALEEQASDNFENWFMRKDMEITPG